jgi:hypothetical protein
MLLTTRKLILPAITVLLSTIFGVGSSYADSEGRWYGYSVVDDTSGRLVYGASKSYIVSVPDADDREQRIGFQCNNDLPLLTIDVGDFLAPSSTDFELQVRVDDLEPITLDMRIWSNGTTGGFSRIEVIVRDLFAQMRDGMRMTWRIGSEDSGHAGMFSLIGFTSATREFAANCDVLREAPEEAEL